MFRTFVAAGLMCSMVAGAWLTQHMLGYQPCALCVEIRFWLILSSLLLLLTVPMRQRLPLLAGLAQALAGLALLAAVGTSSYLVLMEEGFIPAHGCLGLTFFESTLQFGRFWPGMFGVEGMCGMSEPLYASITYAHLSSLAISIVSIVCLYCIFSNVLGWFQARRAC